MSKHRSVGIPTYQRYRRCLSVLVLLDGSFMTVGCMTHRLQVKLLNQAGSLANVYYQEVLDNLAMIEADPTSMPYFSDPQTAGMGIQQSVNGGNRVDWDLVSTAPTGVLSLFDRFLFSHEAATAHTLMRNQSATLWHRSAARLSSPPSSASRRTLKTVSGPS